MRRFSYLTLLAAPAVLMAQAPAPKSLADVYNENMTAVQGMLESLKSQEALAKAESLIPNPLPVFNSKDLKPAKESVREFQGLAFIYRLCSNATVSNGDWDKAKAYLVKALEAGTAAQAGWKTATDAARAIITPNLEKGRKFLADNGPVQKELEERLPREEKEIQAAVEAASKKKLKPEERSALQARRSKFADDSQTLQDIRHNAQMWRDYEANMRALAADMDRTAADCAAFLKPLQDRLAELEGTMQKRQAEIDDFIALETKKLGKKSKKTIGVKEWVNAAMNSHDNVLKQPTPRGQHDFLMRLAFMAPENKAVQAALENIRQGKDPFAVEKKAKGGKGKAKAKAK